MILDLSQNQGLLPYALHNAELSELGIILHDEYLKDIRLVVFIDRASLHPVDIADVIEVLIHELDAVALVFFNLIHNGYTLSRLV